MTNKIKHNRKQYWEGNSNRIVRYWVYLHRGLDFVNQARYWILGILAIYALLKFTNPLWLVAMFILSTPILIIVGRWHLYKVSKTQEFINQTEGTVLGYDQYDLTLKQVELLEEIKNKLV